MDTNNLSDIHMILMQGKSTRHIVKYAEKHCEYTYETFEVFQEAWDRASQLGEEDIEYVTSIAPHDEESDQLALSEEF